MTFFEYKMNELAKTFLLAGNKFMPETYSACGPFTKNQERIEKFMQTGIADFNYKDDIDKACFQHDMAYGKYKNLNKRTQQDRVKTF